MREPIKSFTTRLPAATAKKLKREAKLQKISQAKLVIRIIDGYLVDREIERDYDRDK